jgi:hypothetical protein
MLEYNNARLSINSIFLSGRWKSLLVYFSTPEISRNRKQMRVPDNRLKVRAQIRLYRRSPNSPNTAGCSFLRQ